MNRPWNRNGWSPWHFVLATALVLAAIWVTYYPWADIAYTAMRDEEQSQIFLVPIVAAVLVWVRRGRLRHVRPGGGSIGVFIALAGGILSIVGYQESVYSARHLGAVLVAVGALVSVFGKDVLINFLPAFLVLGFLVPVPGTVRQALSIPLERGTAHVTQQVFEVLGVNSELSGNALMINGVEVQVQEACNGLRMVFALVLISYTFAFATPLRWYARVIVLACSPLSAMVCNVIRLVPTVWLFGQLSHDVADKIHEAAGWVMLPIAFLILLAIIRVLRWALIPVETFTLAYD